MTFIQSVKTCLKKYAIFDGRASRAEFWWWVLFYVLISLATGTMDWIVFSTSFLDEQGFIFYSLFWIGTLLPSLAVTARRFHDINRSGWWVLWWFLILIGTFFITILIVFIILFVFGNFRALEEEEALVYVVMLAAIICIILPFIWLGFKGTKGDNRFGPDPLASYQARGTRMTFIQSIKTCFRKYITFRGRAARSEYWWWVLFLLLASLVVMVMDVVFNTFPEGDAALVLNFIYNILAGGNILSEGDIEEGTGLLITLFWLITFLPDLAVSVRRLHDINRSGWWVPVWHLGLMGLAIMTDLWRQDIAVLGFILLCVWWLIWLTSEGTQGDNRFGSDPLASA